MYASSRSRARGDRDLRREAQVAEDVPDPGLGVFLPELLLNDLGHALEGPEVRGVAVGERPLPEDLPKSLALLLVDLPGPSGVLRFSPRAGVLRAEPFLPSPDSLERHLQAARDLSFRNPRS